MPMVSVSVSISRTLEEIGAFSEGVLLPSTVSQTVRVAHPMTTESANALFEEVEAALAPLKGRLGSPSTYCR